MYLFSFDYPPRPGGIARLCCEIARALARRGELDAVLTAEPGWLGRPAGLREVLLSRRRMVQELQAARFLLNHRAGGVLCGRWWPEAATVVALDRSPVAVLVHGTELLATDKARSVLRKRVLESVQLVVANSRSTSELVLRLAPAARCAVITPAVDHERFCPGDQARARLQFDVPAGARVLATVGRVQSNKGHATVLRALGSLTQSSREKFVYLIAGDGPARSRLKSLAGELAVDAQLRWLGHVSEEVLPEVYRAADLHVLLSEQTSALVEGFGMVSLEAQASGVPALGSDSGGIADAIVVGQGGFIVPAGDVQAVARHLEQLLVGPELYRAEGARGRQRVLRECTWAHYVNALLERAPAMRSSQAASYQAQP